MKAKILFILSITNTDNKHAVNFTAYLDDLPEQSSPAKGTQDILTFFLDVFHIFCFFFFRMSSHPRAIPKCRSNQQTPSGPGDTKSSGEFGGGRASQWYIMWLLFDFFPAYAQGCVSQPHWHMLDPKHPPPVLSLFKMTQRLRGRLEPGEMPMFGLKQNWEGGVMSFHVFIHARLLSNPEAMTVAGWRWKGRLDVRRCGWRLCRSGIEPCRGCWLFNAAWHPSQYVSCSLRRPLQWPTPFWPYIGSRYSLRVVQTIWAFGKSSSLFWKKIIGFVFGVFSWWCHKEGMFLNFDKFCLTLGAKPMKYFLVQNCCGN